MEDTSTWTEADWDAWEDTIQEPTDYAPEPKLNGVDSVAMLAALANGIRLNTHETPNNAEQALKYARVQHHNCNPPDKYGSTWENDCLAFCHCAYGLLTGGEPYAYHQWLDLKADQKHATTSTGKAPLGSFLFSKGSSPFGHIMIAARPFPSGTPAAWSTDLWETGKVGKVARTAVRTKWGHKILGWGTAINGYDLDLTHKEK